MTKIKEPILLDRTGLEIINAINNVANAIGQSEDYVLEQQATGIVLGESSNPAWTRLGNKQAIDRVINEYGAIVIDPVHKKYALLSDNDLDTFADGTPWAGTYGEAIRHFGDLHYLVKTDENGKQVVWGSHHHLNGHTMHENFIGCYQGSVGADGKLHSRPNVAVTTSRTMSQFWDCAQLHGNEWGLMNYHDYQKMILMHLLHFGTANSDETMGTGLHGNPSGGNWYNYRTGSCALKGIYTGSLPHSENESFKQCHLFGVEGLAGGSWEFRPNIRFNGVDAIVYEGNIVSNTAEGRVFQRDPDTNLNGSYIKKMALGEHFDVIPVEGGGDSSHYWCDGAWSAAGGQLLLVGGGSTNGSLCGLAASVSNNGFSVSAAHIGARLSFHGSLDEFELVSGQELAAAQA